MKIVGAPPGGMAKNVVGGDDEAVALKFGGVCEGNGRGRVVMMVVAVCVRMIQFHELVESLFAIRGAARLIEDLIGCRVFGSRPGREG